jgi:hypothetical protein
MREKNMTPAAISLLICVILVILVIAYYWFQLRQVISGKHKSPSAVVVEQQQQKRKDDPVLAKVKPMYKPVEVGHRTGREKLFMTSKGLRSYETNEFNFPMPPRKDF